MQKNNLIITTKTHVLSKNQAKFNKLVADIQKVKEEKAEIDKKLREVQEKVAKTVLPLATENKNKLIEMLFQVDEAYDAFKLTKNEKEAISRFIYDNLDQVINDLETFNEDTSKLKALYEKHTGDNFDESQDSKEDMMHDLFEQMFGFRPEKGQDFDEDFIKQHAETLGGHFGFKPPKEKKKSKKQLEAEAREKEAEDKMKKDARGIYTQLAKLLHPDTEQDETLKLQKEEMMKRVTNAYSANDLYELLQIQLEVEQLDSDSLSKVDDGLMDSYIKVLQKQMAELKGEIQQLTFGNPTFQQYFTSSGKFSDSKLRAQVKQMKDALSYFREIEMNCKNQTSFKNMAKDLIQEFKQEDTFGFNWQF